MSENTALTGKINWQRMPGWSDPRVPFIALLLVYLFVGTTWLGFNRTVSQIGLTIAAACVLDMFLARIIRHQYIVPLSAAITGASLGILLNYAHGPWLPLAPVFFAIASKYLFTFEKRHVFNPSLFGVVASLLLTDGMFSVAPAYQWGGTLSVSLFIVTAALVVFVFRIQRTWLILSFLLFYGLALAYRAWLTRWHLPPETLFIGTLASPAFYLFTFFMITDPATSPRGRGGQVLMALSIVLIDLLLHRYQSYSTLFFAGFIYFTVRFFFLHIRAWQQSWILRLKTGAWVSVFVSAIGGAGFVIYDKIIQPQVSVDPGFQLTAISAESAGIHSRAGNMLERVDPRIAHVAKWLMSIGDAVAISDVNGDQLPDMFLTYPMKHPEDRLALYLNQGDFKFERVQIPVLKMYAHNPEKYGLPSGALWFDYDNDGDKDLLILFSFGQPRLLHNMLHETGFPDFEDRSQPAGLDAYIISLAANVLDMDNDGRLDLIIGNAMNPWLPDYSQPTPFNIFQLPPAEYAGDRRMFNFMHRSWYNASNGGKNLVFMNTASHFERRDADSIGLSGTRWTLDVGTGDIDGDGLTDLYLANDFGPDALYRNTGQGRFKEIRGRRTGAMGRDTYKGMNATLADFDNNGFPDIYVSNVHEPLQAEGSLLWMNNGQLQQQNAGAFRDEAVRRNVLNEQRFGWGAAAGDLNHDGRLDIVQANGMVDDAYDQKFTECPDYWYWNAKVALTGPDIHGYADTWADLRGYCIFPAEMNRIYMNQGKHFVDVADAVKFGTPGNSRGIALADMDNDGDLDILVTHQFAPLSIYRNDLPANEQAWLGLALEGNGKTCNRDAVGTRIELRDKNANGEFISQFREVTASNGFSAQGDPRLVFGLGDDADERPETDEVEILINWCGEVSPQRLLLTTGVYHRIQQKGG
ncbi:MAG TPA: hypothetical protein ENK04_04015 [Gammaproteobacteria bacterium]|nr:hypothetical protein [Gammaproteobacteria bacterium]